jgi:LysR family transcriptional repressor of citA
MLQDGLLDVAYSYQPLLRSGFLCELFQTDELLLVTSPENTLYKNGIRKEELPRLNYLFCNFALQEVGQFIRELFPPFYQFPFEIDNSTKLISYLQAGIGYSFLPSGLVASCLEDKTLLVIPLLDFEAPRINCYCCHPEGFAPAVLSPTGEARSAADPQSSPALPPRPESGRRVPDGL